MQVTALNCFIGSSSIYFEVHIILLYISFCFSFIVRAFNDIVAILCGSGFRFLQIALG